MKKLFLVSIYLLSMLTVSGHEIPHDQTCGMTFDQCRALADQMYGFPAKNEQRWKCFNQFQNKMTFEECHTLTDEMYGFPARNEMAMRCSDLFKN